MATGSEELFEQLRSVLFTDSAVAGEGAAFGVGLIMLGFYFYILFFSFFCKE
jgi:26S proteasome regulatory subunit N2